VAQGNREWGLSSVHHKCLCHSFLLRGRNPHSLPLLQRGVPPMGNSPPGTSPVWVLPTCCSSSQTAPLWVLSTCPCSFRNKLLQVWDPHGVTSPARSLVQHGLSMVSQPSSGFHLLWCGVLHGLQVDVCSTMDLHELQENNLPHHGLLHGLQGNLCSSTWTTSFLASSLTLVSAQLFV